MDKSIPKSLKNLDQWNLSRRKFIKGLALAGIASQIPFITSCLNEEEDFTKKYEKTIKAIQQILLPDDGFGPGAIKINAYNYFIWATADIQMDLDDRNFVFNGLKWTEQLSEKEYSKAFFELDIRHQKIIVIKMTDLDWGKTWLSVMMTFILEALLSNPLYGGNPNQEAWRWLNHYAGSPQPDKTLMYPEIFKTIEQKT